MRTLKDLRPGDPISASQLNEIQRLVTSLGRSSGRTFFQDSTGLHVRSERFENLGDALVSVKFATAAALSPSPTVTDAQTLTFGSAPTVDGTSMSTEGVLVLVKNQTTSKNNGIYRVGAANVWTRIGGLRPGMMVTVRQGTRNSGTIWVLATEGPITIGTTSLTFKNQSWNEFINVKAAFSSRSTSMDGITINAGDYVLVTGGTSLGAWQLVDATPTWEYLGLPKSACVQQGATFGKLIMILSAAGSSYVRGNAAWA